MSTIVISRLSLFSASLCLSLISCGGGSSSKNTEPSKNGDAPQQTEKPQKQPATASSAYAQNHPDTCITNKATLQALLEPFGKHPVLSDGCLSRESTKSDLTFITDSHLQMRLDVKDQGQYWLTNEPLKKAFALLAPKKDVSFEQFKQQVTYEHLYTHHTVLGPSLSDAGLVQEMPIKMLGEILITSHNQDSNRGFELPKGVPSGLYKNFIKYNVYKYESLVNVATAQSVFSIKVNDTL